MNINSLHRDFQYSDGYGILLMRSQQHSWEH